MSERTLLRGKFTVLNAAHLRHRASLSSDPRHVFFRAMLETDTYEAYLAATRSIVATTGDRKQDDTDGRSEILYARRNGWIADEPNSN